MKECLLWAIGSFVTANGLLATTELVNFKPAPDRLAELDWEASPDPAKRKDVVPNEYFVKIAPALVKHIVAPREEDFIGELETVLNGDGLFGVKVKEVFFSELAFVKIPAGSFGRFEARVRALAQGGLLVPFDIPNHRHPGKPVYWIANAFCRVDSSEQ